MLHWKITEIICYALRLPSRLNNHICQYCGMKTSTVTPSFYYVFNISLSCNNSRPSFLGNMVGFFFCCTMFEILLSFHKGKCEKITQDLVERFWTFLTTLDSNTVAQFMKDNLAGTVVVFSLLIWIPASCYVNRIVSGLHICRHMFLLLSQELMQTLTYVFPSNLERTIIQLSFFNYHLMLFWKYFQVSCRIISSFIWWVSIGLIVTVVKSFEVTGYNEAMFLLLPLLCLGGRHLEGLRNKIIWSPFFGPLSTDRVSLASNFTFTWASCRFVSAIFLRGALGREHWTAKRGTFKRAPVRWASIYRKKFKKFQPF